MLAHKFGVIVNVGSMAHRRGGPVRLGALRRGQGRGGDHDHGRGRANSRRKGLCVLDPPWPIDTVFAAAAATSPELKQKMLDDVPIGRFGTAEEIGESLLSMCSDACEFMTANTVDWNGGGGWR